VLRGSFWEDERAADREFEGQREREASEPDFEHGARVYGLPKGRVRDVLEAIANIEKYSARGRGAFGVDELLRSWFVRQLEISGEAVRAIPDGTRALAPWMPCGEWGDPEVRGIAQVDCDSLD